MARINEPPADVIVGMVRGQWPVQTFTVDQHAIVWAQQAPAGEVRYLWRARLTDLVPLEVVSPGPATLVEVP